MKTIKGIFWMAALRLFIRVISVLKIAILARLLNPLQFGLFGIASVSLAFTEILTETGVNALLIQKKRISQLFFNSSWVILLTRGFLIFLILLIASSPVSYFFRSPESYKVLLLMSFVPLLRGFVNPAIIFFQKKLLFYKEFIFWFVVNALEALTSIIIVFITRSVYGLIWGLIVSSIFEIVASWLFVKPRPNFKIKFNNIKSIVRRGKYITLSSIFNYLFHNLDDIIVGRVLGLNYLGLYQVVYKIAILPITESGEIVSKVVFPVYTRLFGERFRLKKAFLKVLIFLSLIIIPVTIFIVLFADEFIMLFLGRNWLEAVPTLRVLMLFGAVRAISGSSSALFLAVRRQEYITIVNLVSLIAVVILIYPLVIKFNIIGAAYSVLIASLLSIPFMFAFSKKILNEKS